MADNTPESPEARRGSELARQLVTMCLDQFETKDPSLWNEAAGPIVNEIYAHFELATDAPELLALQQATVKLGHGVLRSLAMMVVVGIDVALPQRPGADSQVARLLEERGEKGRTEVRRFVVQQLMAYMDENPTFDS